MTANDFDRLLPHLNARLRMLARASSREAPRSLEAALVAEFRKRCATRTARWQVWWHWAAGAAAACLLVAAVAAVLGGRPARKPAVPAAVTAPPLVSVARDVAGSKVAPAPVRRSTRSARSRVAPPGPDEVATGFIPVSYALLPAEHVSLVRVRLPRSALPSFGLPMNVERSGGSLEADVLLGEDGVARAIRFVR